MQNEVRVVWKKNNPTQLRDQSIPRNPVLQTLKRGGARIVQRLGPNKINKNKTKPDVGGKTTRDIE